jgi:hypothetical protein
MTRSSSRAGIPSTLLINLGWAAAVVPALWIGASVDGRRGAAVVHVVVGVVVAVPLAVLALRRAGVRLARIGPALVRPALARVLAGVVALVVREVAGPSAFVQLAVAGTGGLAVYLATAVPRRQLPRWIAAIRPRKEPAAEPAGGSAQ